MDSEGAVTGSQNYRDSVTFSVGTAKLCSNVLYLDKDTLISIHPSSDNSCSGIGFLDLTTCSSYSDMIQFTGCMYYNSTQPSTRIFPNCAIKSWDSTTKKLVLYACYYPKNIEVDFINRTCTDLLATEYVVHFMSYSLSKYTVTDSVNVTDGWPIIVNASGTFIYFQSDISSSK